MLEKRRPNEKPKQTNRRIGLDDSPAGARALNHLRRALESGRFPLHARLPPERALAVELGVGRSTLRKALAALEAEGWIWRHVGRGTFVGRHPVAPHAPGAWAADRPGSPAEVMEVRLMFEPAIAALAALRARPTEIAYMKRCLGKSETAPDWQTYERWDSTLHRAIAEASHNSLMLSFLEAINELRRQEDWGQLRRASLTPDRQRRYSEQHRAMVDAIAARDSPAAAQAMRRHLETVQRGLFDALDPAAGLVAAAAGPTPVDSS